MKDKEEYLGYSDDPMGHLLILEQYRDKGSSPGMGIVTRESNP